MKSKTPEQQDKLNETKMYKHPKIATLVTKLSSMMWWLVGVFNCWGHVRRNVWFSFGWYFKPSFGYTKPCKSSLDDVTSGNDYFHSSSI